MGDLDTYEEKDLLYKLQLGSLTVFTLQEFITTYGLQLTSAIYFVTKTKQ